MKPANEQQGQNCIPVSSTVPDDKLPKSSTPKSKWQRYLDGDWNPMSRQPAPDKDLPTKFN